MKKVLNTVSTKVSEAEPAELVAVMVTLNGVETPSPPVPMGVPWISALANLMPVGRPVTCTVGAGYPVAITGIGVMGPLRVSIVWLAIGEIDGGAWSTVS